MSNNVKTYFLVSGWDFPVGSITLGSVIANPEVPHQTLYDAKLSSAGGDIDVPTWPSDKYDFTETITTTKKGHVGLFARFLQLFGLGVEASMRYDKKAVDKYSFKHMHTEWFDAVKSDTLLKKAVIDCDRVKHYIEQTDYEAPVYMITGLKTVEGASVTTVKNKGSGFRAIIGVDVAQVVALGPDAKHEKTTEDNATFKNSSHIVFAYQLIEIRCDAAGKTEVKQFNKGALFGIDDDSEEASQTTPAAQEDFSAPELEAGFDNVVQLYDEMDDGDIACFAPKQEDQESAAQ